MEVKRAFTQQEGWVHVACEWCNTEYSCHVSESGTADTGLLGLAGIVPSDETVMAAAKYDLNLAMQRAARLIPCPKCGKFCNDRVMALQERRARIARWLSFIGIAALLSVILVALDARAWTLLVILVVAWFGANIVARIAAAKVDPNQNPGANRVLAQKGIARGVVRLETPAK